MLTINSAGCAEGLTMYINQLLLPHTIFGAEEPQKTADVSSPNKSDNTEDPDPDGSNELSEHDDANDPKVRGLKSALEKERQANRAKEAELRELRELKREKEEAALKEKSELEQAQIREQRAEARAQKLAEGYLRQSLDNAVKSAAAKANFIDPEDALAGVDWESITYEQDSENPDKVTIDEQAVAREVKKLATKKPHFIKRGTDDGEPSGSPFGGSKQKKQATTEDQLKAKYPGL